MVDINNTSPKYWEAVLAKENLSMSRGRRRTDEIAEQMFCEDRARRLQEAGQALPTLQELSGCTEIDPDITDDIMVADE